MKKTAKGFILGFTAACVLTTSVTAFTAPFSIQGSGTGATSTIQIQLYGQFYL